MVQELELRENQPTISRREFLTVTAVATAVGLGAFIEAGSLRKSVSVRRLVAWGLAGATPAASAPQAAHPAAPEVTLPEPKGTVVPPPEPAMLPSPSRLGPAIRYTVGVRNDDPTKMSLLRDLGVAGVRSDGHFEDFKAYPEVLRTIRAAKRQSLQVMLVYNPSHSISDYQMREDLAVATSELAEGDGVELGCEGDNPLLWKGDLRSFARFTTSAFWFGKKLRPDLLWVMGSMSNNGRLEGSYKPYGQALRDIGFDSSKAVFAFHAYDYTEDLLRQINDITTEVGPLSLIATELGAGKSLPREQRPAALVKLLQSAKDKGVGNSFIHELNDANGSGLINPINGKPEATFYAVQKFIRQQIPEQSPTWSTQ